MTKEIKLIDTEEVVFISDNSYFVKSDFCRHNYNQICSKCILFGSYIPLQVLKAVKNGSGSLK